MKIRICEPEGPYNCVLDTGVMDVQITDAFVGATFKTDDGEKLTVVMRDGGFEVHYSGDFGDEGFDTDWTEFKNGDIRRSGEKR